MKLWSWMLPSKKAKSEHEPIAYHSSVVSQEEHDNLRVPSNLVVPPLR